MQNCLIQLEFQKEETMSVIELIEGLMVKGILQNKIYVYLNLTHAA